MMDLFWCWFVFWEIWYFFVIIWFKIRVEECWILREIEVLWIWGKVFRFICVGNIGVIGI